MLATDEFSLGALEGLGSGYRGILKLSVEFRDELRRRLIVNEPQGGECTPGSSLNGHSRSPSAARSSPVFAAMA